MIGQGCRCDCSCHSPHMKDGRCINSARAGSVYCYGCLSEHGCKRDFRPEVAAKSKK